MAWLWIIAALVVLFVLASLSRKKKQRSAVAALRASFPAIARMRLVSACPALDGVLDDRSLRMLFDWMLIEMCRRTGVSGFGELMQWSVEKGQQASERLTSDVAREAVERLPQPVLAVIDDCRGRAFAAVLVEQALTEAGRRIAPELNSEPA